MPLFTYRAVTVDNRVTSGSLSAPSAEEVNEELVKRNLKPLKIQQQTKINASSGTLPLIEKITFCRYVATMLSSGLSLSEGVAVLKVESKHPVMKQILNDVLYYLERGQTLSNALSMYPKVFDKFFIALVKAGEISGTMAESFNYLETELKAEYSLTSKIKGALMYPGFVFLAMIGIGGLMVFFVMPQIGAVFLKMTMPLPVITRSIFQLSINLAKVRVPVMVSMVIFVSVLFMFMRKPIGKRVLINLISPIPIIKGLLAKIDIARFCRIFSTLIASAVPITEALEIALISLSRPFYQKIARPVVKQIMQGKTISAVFKDYKAFPPLLLQMIAGGEKSGTLDKTLADLASFYEEEVEESVKKATQLLEPILMLIVGIGVGGMILSIIAPMYSVVGSLQQR